MLIQMFALDSKTLRHNLTHAELVIVDKIAVHENMFGRPLPNDIFYKAIAIAACKRAVNRVLQA